VLSFRSLGRKAGRIGGHFHAGHLVVFVLGQGGAGGQASRREQKVSG
jgi:hypothetical protein